ncbi:hypothetical protein V5F77_05225 [Xanthobacter sp. DSM 24535]|uniref:hypothetical protein n=1 Tax=Roseixanthobacter psychrophilus TaxID=3119917 RepID=UPI003729658E
MNDGARYWVFIIVVVVVMNSLALASINRRIERIDAPSFVVHMEDGKAYRVTPLNKD